MADSNAHFGNDLRLLGDFVHQQGRDRGSDLFVVTRPETGLVDLETVGNADNLAQALLLRFLTPAGELASLGHPSYGSRLYELIGELNTQTNRNRAKMFVLQALAEEPRISKIQDVRVTQGTDDRTRVDVALSLLVIDSDTPLNLVFGFSLEGVAA